MPEKKTKAQLESELAAARKRIAALEKRLTAAKRKPAPPTEPQIARRWQALIENSAEAVSLLAADGSVIFANPSAWLMWDVSPEELERMNFMEFLHPDDLAKAVELFQRVLQEPHQPVTGQVRCKDNRGGWLWVEATGANLLDDPDVQAIVVNYRDISGRKKIEEALREKEALYRMLAEASQDIIFIIGRQGQVEYVNQHAARQFLKQPEELIGRQMADLFPREVAEEQQAGLLRVFESGESLYVESQAVFPGEALWLGTWLVPLKDETGQVKSVMGVARDITERQRAEERLIRSEEEYRYLFENNPHPMLVYDLKSLAFLSVNDAAVDKYGYTRDEFLGMTIADIRPKEDVERLLKNIAQPRPALQHSGEWRHTLKDGRVIDVEITSHTIALSGREAALVVAQDITERKRAEEKIEQRNRELEALQATILDIASPHSLTELLHIIVERACALLDVPGGGLYLCDAARQEARCVVSFNTPRDYRGTTLKYGEGAAGRVAQTGEPLIVDDYRTWSGRAATFDPDQPFERVMSIPMKWEDRVTGVIHALRSGGSPFHADDLELLALFANHAALAVEQARLREALERELSERKQAETSLRESEERSRTSLESMLDAFGVYAAIRDPSGRIVDFRVEYVNAAACAANRMTREEQTGKGLLELLPAHRETGLFDEYCHLVETGNPLVEESLIYEDTFGGGQRVRKAVDIHAVKMGDGFIAVWRDVTARKQIDEALRAAEEDYRAIFEQAPFGIFQSTPEGRFLKVNQSLARIYGYDSPEEVVETVHDIAKQIFVDPDDRREFTRLLEEQGQVVDFESLEKRKDGSRIWTSNNARVVKDADGKILHYEGFIRDITARKQAEAHVWEQARLLDLIFQYSLDNIVLLDKDFNFIRVSQSYAKATQRDISDFPGHNHFEFYPSNFKEEAEDVKRGKYVYSKTARPFIFPDHPERGTSYWNLGLVPILDSDGEVELFLFTLKEVTENQRAEEALRAAEEKYRAIFEGAVEGIFQSTPEGRFLTVNPALARLWGYASPEELIAGVTDIASQTYADSGIRSDFMRKIKEDGEVRGFEYRARRKDETVMWCSENARAVRDATGTILYYEGNIQDITERKQAEEALRQSEERFRLLAESSLTGIYLFQEGRFRYVNQSLASLFGYRVEEVVDRLGPLDLTHPEDRPRVVENVRRRTEGEVQDIRYEFRGLRKDGAVIYAEVHGQRIEYGGKVGIIGTLVDITERTRAVKALEESEERYRAIFEQAPVGIIQSTPAGRYNKVNAAMARMFGYDSPEEMLAGVTDIASQIYVDAADREEFKRLMTEYGKVAEFVSRNRRRDGGIVWTSVNARAVRNESGEIIYYEGFIRDITEQMRAEKALQEKEEQYRTLVEQLPAVVYMDDATGEPGNSLFVSPQVEKILGMKEEEWIAGGLEKWLGMIHPEDRERVRSEYLRGYENREPFNCEYRIVHPEGRILWIEDKAVTLRDENGAPTFTHGILYDVTERKRAELALQESGKFLRQVIDLVPHFIFAKDRDSRFLLVNQAVADAYGTTVTDIVGKSDIDFSATPEQARHFHEDDVAVIESGQPKFIPEEPITDTQGNIRYLQTTKIPFWFGLGNIPGILGVAVNITERKRAEQALRHSQEQLLALIRQAPLNIAMFDREMRYIAASQRWVAEYGRGATDLIGRSHYEINPDLPERWKEAHRRGLAGESLQNDEDLWVHEDGAKEWLRWAVVPWRDAEGQIGGVILFVEDITARKQAEEQVLASEARFRALIANAGDMIVVINAEGKIVFASPSSARILGYSPEEMIGRDFREWIHADDLPAVNKSLAHRSQVPGTAPNSLKIHTLHKDGTWRVVDALGTNMFAEPAIQGIVLNIRDVTEQERANREIRKRTEDLVLINTLNEAVNRGDSLDAVVDILVGEARNMLACRDATVYLVSPDGRFLVMPHLTLPSLLSRQIEQLIGMAIPPIRIPIREGSFIQRLLRSEEGVITSDPQEMQTWMSEFTETIQLPAALSKTLRKLVPSIYKMLDIRSTISIPLVSEGNIIGLLDVSSASLFTEDDLKRVRNISGQITSAILRKQAEDALRESEAGLNRAQALAHLGSWTLDVKNDVLKWSAETYRMFGVPFGKPLDLEAFLACVHPEDRALVAEKWAVALTGAPYDVEHRIVVGETVKWVRERAEIQFDADGLALTGIGTVHDITDRKRADAVIARRVAELEALYESGLTINSLLNPKEIAQKVIEILEQKLQWHHIAVRRYHPETEGMELLAFSQHGLNATEVEEQAGRLSQMLSRSDQGLSGWVMRSGEPLRVGHLSEASRYAETFSGMQSGLYVPLQIGKNVIGSIAVESEIVDAFSEADERLLSTLAGQAAVAIENANLFILAQQELGERKQAEAALRRLNTELERRVAERTAEIEATRQRLALAASAAGLGIWEYDPNAGTVYWDERMYELHGVGVGEFDGSAKAWRDFVHEEERRAAEVAIQRALRKGERYEDEYRITRPDGSVRHIHAFGIVFRDAEQKPRSIIGVDMDVTADREVERALQQYSEEIADLYNNAPGGYHSLDAEGRFVRVNNTMLRWLGYGRDELIGKPALDFLPPDSARTFEESFSRFKETGQLQNLELEFHCKDGRPLVVSLNASAVRDENGNFVQSRSTSVDITEKVQADRALRESEIQNRLLFEGSPDAILLFDLEGRIVRANRASEELTGLSQADLLGNTLDRAGLVTPNLHEQIMNSLLRPPVQNDAFATVEFPLTHTDGSIRDVDCRSFRLALIGEQRILATVRDVTRRKRAEQTSRESEAYARLLFDAIPNPVTVMDSNGVIVDVNRGFEAQYGLERNRARGRFISELGIFLETEIARTNQYLEAVMRGEPVPHFESPILASDGEMRTLEWHSYPVTFGGKRLVLSTNHDITDHKKAEETLRLANAEMERALRLKDEFLANMSHELRTPLNAVLGISESLEERIIGPLNEKQLKYVRTINESGHHLLTLINDILDLSKIEAGRVELDLTETLVEPLCQSSLRMVKEQAKKKDLNVRFEQDNSARALLADERRLKQMLVNLLINAVKFTPPGGKMGLKVTAYPENGEIAFTVWDTGIGISSEDIPRLFKPFVQLDSRLSREHTGTGLGLALTAQMARLHGGNVSVESLPEQGSRFTITLPWDPALGEAGRVRLGSEAEASEVESAPASGAVILLVEDTEEVTMLIRDYLTSNGHHVITARNGLEGVAQAVRVKPGLILMDVMMPDMDGVEATLRIRQEASLKKVPIIALTALAMEVDRKRCLAAGMNDFISKPVTMKNLLGIVQKYLGRQEQA